VQTEVRKCSPGGSSGGQENKLNEFASNASDGDFATMCLWKGHGQNT